MQAVGCILLFLVVMLGLSWLVLGNEFFIYQYFAPKTEAVRRQVFEESKAYNQGQTQELENMLFQCQSADKEHKAALEDIILHRASDYDVNRLPPHLRRAIEDMRVNRFDRLNPR
jgi:hypothetical protein